jgi:thiol-disulfide isomerase/thioredoxin
MFNVALALIWIFVSGCQARLNEQPGIDRIVLNELSGEPIDFDQYRGKTIFINIWATWCKPCIEEMPSIEKAQSILQDRDIVFLLASDEEKERIASFVSKRQTGLHYVQVQNLEEIGVQVLPVTYIINSRGETAFSEAGYRRWDDPSNLELLKKIIDDRE